MNITAKLNEWTIALKKDMKINKCSQSGLQNCLNLMKAIKTTQELFSGQIFYITFISLTVFISLVFRIISFFIGTEATSLPIGISICVRPFFSLTSVMLL